MTEEDIKSLEETLKNLNNQKPMNDINVEFEIEKDDVLKETQRNGINEAIRRIKT